jgi:MOSC domain-containing protein YiiM
MTERVVSVNVGLPIGVPYRGNAVQTGIFKAPVESRVHLGPLGLEGDGQADLAVHGGPERAAYVYSTADLDWWAEQLGFRIPPAELGENLTVTGLVGDEVLVGDLLRVGEALVQPTGPREPCFKLGIRMGDTRFPARFRDAGRTGFYVRVIEEGTVGAGDPIEVVARDPAGFSIGDVHRLYVGGREDEAGLRRALTVGALSENWRAWSERRLAELTAAAG